MRTVISVMGTDTTGIIAKVSNMLMKNDINIVDISQTVLGDVFAMIMLVDMSTTSIKIKGLSILCDELADKEELSIHVQHEDIFNAMHRI